MQNTIKATLVTFSFINQAQNTRTGACARINKIEVSPQLKCCAQFLAHYWKDLHNCYQYLRMQGVIAYTSFFKLGENVIERYKIMKFLNVTDKTNLLSLAERSTPRED